MGMARGCLLVLLLGASSHGGMGTFCMYVCNLYLYCVQTYLYYIQLVIRTHESLCPPILTIFSS